MNRPPRYHLSLALLSAAGLATCGGDSEPPTEPPDPNRAPVAVGSIPAQTVTGGEIVSLDASPYFSDPDGDTLTYAATTSDTAVATASVEDGMLTISGVAAGTATVTVTATDPEGLSATQTAGVTVEAANEAPVAVGSIPAQTVTGGEIVSLDVSPYFSDPDGDTLTYAATTSDTAVATASVEDGMLTISGVAAGTATVTVTATDPEGLSATQTAGVTVEAANQAPVAVGSIPAQTVTAGKIVSLDASPYFSDPDGDALTYAATTSDTAVATASVEDGMLTISGVAAGTATVTVTATDPEGLSATQTAGVTVEAANEAPVAVGSIPAQTVTAGKIVSLDASPYFSDPDGDALTYAATTSDTAVATASVEDGMLRISGVAAGTATVTVTATDPEGLSATQTAGVTVEAANEAPVAVGSIPAQTVTAGKIVSLDASRYFTDPDGDALTYEATTSDLNVAIAVAEGSTVKIGGVTQGTTTLTVTASDPHGLRATQDAEVTVARGPLLREDFDSRASLDAWYVSSRARAEVVRGILKVTNTEELSYGYIRRRVLDTNTEDAVPVTDWEVTVRVARQQTNARMMLWLWMDHDRYLDFILEIGSGRQVDGQDTNYRFWVWDDDRDGSGEGGRIYIRDFGYGFSDAINDGPGEFTEMTLSVKGRRLEIVADGTVIFKATRLPSGLPANITHVVLATAHTESAAGATSLFDWVEVNGEGTGSTSAIGADRGDRLPDLKRMLDDRKVEKHTDPAAKARRKR